MDFHNTSMHQSQWGWVNLAFFFVGLVYQSIACASWPSTLQTQLCCDANGWSTSHTNITQCNTKTATPTGTEVYVVLVTLNWILFGVAALGFLTPFVKFAQNDRSATFDYFVILGLVCYLMGFVMAFVIVVNGSKITCVWALGSPSITAIESIRIYAPVAFGTLVMLILPMAACIAACVIATIVYMLYNWGLLYFEPCFIGENHNSSARHADPPLENPPSVTHQAIQQDNVLHHVRHGSDHPPPPYTEVKV